MTSKKQILTIAIACAQECPSDLPDTCLECPLFSQAQTSVVEVLTETRCADEVPPPINKLGQWTGEQSELEATKM